MDTPGDMTLTRAVSRMVKAEGQRWERNNTGFDSLEKGTSGMQPALPRTGWICRWASWPHKAWIVRVTIENPMFK